MSIVVCEFVDDTGYMSNHFSAGPLLSTTVDCDTVPHDRYDIVSLTMDVPATPTDVAVLWQERSGSLDTCDKILPYPRWLDPI